jgi:anaphase-promoting complex subunit 8
MRNRAAELLNSLDEEPNNATKSPENNDKMDNENDEDDTDEAEDYDGPIPITAIANSDPAEARLEVQESSKYMLAKSLFDCHEYDRCAAVFLGTKPLLNSTGGETKGKSKANKTTKVPSRLLKISQRSLFLALYAKFMAGEKRKDEDSEMILGPQDGGVTINRELIYIQRVLDEWFEARADSEDGGQGWLEYLYGIVLSKSKNEEDAQKWLIRSVNVYPFNWGAWQELNDLVGSVEHLQQIVSLLPSHPMSPMFALYANQMLYQSTEDVHAQLDQLLNIFPKSQFLQTQRALLFYHSRDFQVSDSIFTKLITEDPYRLDGLDHYSNILQVMEARPKLAFIAQLASAVDKFRPETCCIIGNYYSATSEHEKAVMYFRRALTLDRCFLSAWTLMGHEYIQMKNTHAAIEAYRRAVDVNRKDYRAWHALGLAYELLEMQYYALFYHQRAAAIKPYDPEMWQAVATCFNKMDRPLESIKAYKRALIAGTYQTGGSFGEGGLPDEGSGGGVMDPDTLYQIGLMYEKLGNHAQAAGYMALTLAQEERLPSSGDGELMGESSGGVGVTITTSKARMWLAKWEASQKNFTKAIELCNELCQDGVEIEDAKALIRDLRSRMERGG